jgi:hypothetical protein
MLMALAGMVKVLAFAGPVTSVFRNIYRNARSLAWPVAKGGFQKRPSLQELPLVDTGI